MQYLRTTWQSEQRDLELQYDFSTRSVPANSLPGDASSSGYYDNGVVIRMQETAAFYGLDWASAVKIARLQWRLREVSNMIMIEVKLLI